MAALTVATARIKPERAQAWALTELGSPKPSWSDQLQAPWSGYCEAFVEIAYGTRHLYGTALADYSAQKAAGRIHTDTEPPAGALVFYGGGSTGHVALSVGGGQVITTWGFEGQHYPVVETQVRAFSNPYYGWADAPDTWPGR
jgi:cell wall-associated NlpC family hydrolase